MPCQLSMKRVSVMGPMLCTDSCAHKTENNTNCLIPHLPQPPYASIANPILILAKLQSHKLEHKEKQNWAVSTTEKWYYAIQESFAFTPPERVSLAS